jgi:DNA (cytosine-5)-methyltransferase 1
MKYFSMFSGVGGFENGIYRAVERIEASRQTDIAEYCPVFKSGDEERGFRTSCIGFSEIDKYAIQIYQRHFPEHKNYGDATLIDERQLPDFDLLVGGFPCPSFSAAGKRLGFQDPRGTLFFDIARILSHKGPRHFLLENVKGLLSHDNGKTFQTILGVLTDLGYFVEWQVLNSKDFGVAQNRERVFIVGHLGTGSGRKVFPIGGSSQENNQELSSTAIDSNYFKSPDNHGQRTMIAETQKLPDAQRIREIDGCSVTLKGEGGGQGAKTGLYAIPDNKGSVFDGYRIRRLTPVECARLQGFPDDWHGGVSDSQAYRCYGNAVTVNVIEAIMIKLLSITEP